MRFGASVQTRLESSLSQAPRVTRPTPKEIPGPSLRGHGPPFRAQARRILGPEPVIEYVTSSLLRNVHVACCGALRTTSSNTVSSRPVISVSMRKQQR